MDRRKSLNKTISLPPLRKLPRPPRNKSLESEPIPPRIQRRVEEILKARGFNQPTK